MSHHVILLRMSPDVNVHGPFEDTVRKVKSLEEVRDSCRSSIGDEKVRCQ
jgi:hypothetical protein